MLMHLLEVDLDQKQLVRAPALRILRVNRKMRDNLRIIY